MTSTIQSGINAASFDTDTADIFGSELNHLEAISKLMKSYRSDDFLQQDDSISLTNDDINSLGELIQFLTISRRNFDEFCDQQYAERMRSAIEVEQMKCVEMMAAKYKQGKKKKK